MHFSHGFCELTKAIRVNMGPASFSFFVLARGYLQSPQEMFKQISMLFLKNDQVQYSNLETWLLTMVSLTYSHPNNQLNPAM